MNEAGHHLFAGARFTLQKDGGFRRGNLRRLSQHVLPFRRLPDRRAGRRRVRPQPTGCARRAVPRGARASACWRSALASPCSIAAIKSSSAYGFVKNSSAPALIARTDVGMSPWPVRKMIDVRAPDFASRCCRSRPLSPGSRTSSIRQLGTSAQGLARNSWADAKVSTFHPADRTSLPTASRTDASSSTTYTGAA